MQISRIGRDREDEEAPWREENDRLAELISRAKHGSLDAFTELYRRTARWLLSLVRRYVADGMAEDVLAEVYIQVWQSLPRFDPSRAPPSVWLAVIARSRSLDHLRREKLHGSPMRRRSAEAAPGLEAEAEGPEQLLARTQERRLVQLSLSVVNLSPDERLLLGLAYFRDSSREEISLLTGLPLGTVKTVLIRAQRKLRQHLLESASCARADRCSGQPAP